MPKTKRGNASELEALMGVAAAARALVESEMISCQRSQHTDFVPDNGCECDACGEAQKVVDALAKVGPHMRARRTAK